MDKRDIGREGYIDDTKKMPWEKVSNKEVNNEIAMQKDQKGFYERIANKSKEGEFKVSSSSMDDLKKKVAEIKQGFPKAETVEKKKTSISIGM